MGAAPQAAPGRCAPRLAAGQRVVPPPPWGVRSAGGTEDPRGDALERREGLPRPPPEVEVEEEEPCQDAGASVGEYERVESIPEEEELMLWREWGQREEEESRNTSKETGAEWNDVVRSSRPPPRSQQGAESPPLLGSIAAMSLWTSSHERRFWTLMLRRVASGFGNRIPALATSRLKCGARSSSEYLV